ncbi:MAG: hypothetical protein QOK43_1332 [Acidimicrobiaceae bacterium]|nr:hypothetical protein [Acidimicrobiaceae bacterium]
MQNALTQDLADRGRRTESDAQSGIKALLLAAALNLEENDVADQTIFLESQAGSRRRIDIEVGSAVIEVKRDLRPGPSRGSSCTWACVRSPLAGVSEPGAVQTARPDRHGGRRGAAPRVRGRIAARVRRVPAAGRLRRADRHGELPRDDHRRQPGDHRQGHACGPDGRCRASAARVGCGRSRRGYSRPGRPRSAAGRRAWCLFPICVAQLASHNANNSLTIDGPVLSLAPRHAKVRRDGYRR